MPRHNAIRIGLSHVKGLTSRSLRSITGARREARYLSLHDFLERSGVKPSEAETLAECGALDCFGGSRPELMWGIKLFRADARSRRAIPSLPDPTAAEKLASEREILGVCVSAHPLRIHGAKVKCAGVIQAVNLSRNVGKIVKLAGWLVTSKRTRTIHGEFMKFLTMEDETDIFEVTLFPKVYARRGHVLKSRHGPYLVTGKVEDDGGDITVTARGIERLG